jgi:hypothetical protein
VLLVFLLFFPFLPPPLAHGPPTSVTTVSPRQNKCWAPLSTLVLSLTNLPPLSVRPLETISPVPALFTFPPLSGNKDAMTSLLPSSTSPLLPSPSLRFLHTSTDQSGTAFPSLFASFTSLRPSTPSRAPVEFLLPLSFPFSRPRTSPNLTSPLTLSYPNAPRLPNPPRRPSSNGQ